MARGYRKALTVFSIFLMVWLFFRYFYPLISPFLLGFLLALAAEPLQDFFSKRLRLSSAISTGASVLIVLTLLLVLLVLAGALLLRQLTRLAYVLPDVGAAFTAGTQTLSGWILGLVNRLPGPVRPLLSSLTVSLFSGSSALLERLVQGVLNLTAGLLRALPDSLLGLGTGVISAFMICPRLPRFRYWLTQSAGPGVQMFLATLRRIKTALGGWLKAQLKLMGITFAMVCAGFFLLRIPHALLWAALVALVDAFPILGTGTVLLPWSVICFLQDQTARGIGLLGVYGVVVLSRSALEPRLVGRQLGLDPLLTLFSLYAGFKLWGFAGMILSPVLAVAVGQLLQPKPQDG